MKKILILIGIGGGVWFISIFIQLFLHSPLPEVYSFFGESCIATGYPFVRCIDSNNYTEIVMYSLLNTSFWCLIISIFLLLFSTLFNKDY